MLMPHNPELAGQLRLLVHVDLSDADVAARGGDFVDDGADHPARAAPGRPEVQQDGLVAVKNLACKIVPVDMDNRHALCLLRILVGMDHSIHDQGGHFRDFVTRHLRRFRPASC